MTDQDAQVALVELAADIRQLRGVVAERERAAREIDPDESMNDRHAGAALSARAYLAELLGEYFDLAEKIAGRGQ